MALDILICVVGWIIIACHTWALKHHFNMPVIPNGVRLISTLVIISAAILSFLCFYLEQPTSAQIVGLIFLSFSFVLFWVTIRESSKAKLLAAFDEKLPHGLLKTGPYSYVRHPFYTSYLIQWIGWGISAWTIWAIVPILFMTVTYWVAARDEENKFSKTEMADDYKQYISSTGRFFPKIKF